MIQFILEWLFSWEKSAWLLYLYIDFFVVVIIILFLLEPNLISYWHRSNVSSLIQFSMYVLFNASRFFFGFFFKVNPAATSDLFVWLQCSSTEELTEEEYWLHC